MAAGHRLGLSTISWERQLFEAQYIVFSKQVFPFDFTLGYGTKRLDGPFAGMEIALHPQLHFLTEYSPIEYEQDKPERKRCSSRS